jgi:hypothetical protein
MDIQLNELSKGIRPTTTQTNKTLGLRRKNGSMMSLISLSEQISLINMQKTTTRKINPIIPHQYPNILSQKSEKL